MNLTLNLEICNISIKHTSLAMIPRCLNKHLSLDGNIMYKKTTVDYEEDSSDAFSPEQPASNEAYGSPPLVSNVFSATSLIHTLPSSTWTEVGTVVTMPVLVEIYLAHYADRQTLILIA